MLIKVRQILSFGDRLFTELGGAFAGRSDLQPLQRELIAIVSLLRARRCACIRSAGPEQALLRVQQGRCIAWRVFLNTAPKEGMRHMLDRVAQPDELWPTLCHSVAHELELAFCAGWCCCFIQACQTSLLHEAEQGPAAEEKVGCKPPNLRHLLKSSGTAPLQPQEWMVDHLQQFQDTVARRKVLPALNSCSSSSSSAPMQPLAQAASEGDLAFWLQAAALRLGVLSCAPAELWM